MTNMLPSNDKTPDMIHQPDKKVLVTLSEIEKSVIFSLFSQLQYKQITL